MATTMNMSGYEIERGVDASEEYGDEVMCAGWNPQLDLVCNCPLSYMDKHEAFVCELANVDLDAFLQKMYKFQR